MPAGVGLELVLVFVLLGLLVVAFLVGRRLRETPIVDKPRRGEGLGARIKALAGKDRVTDEEWSVLEESLVRADAGREAASEIVTRVRERYEPGSDPTGLLVEEITGMFDGDTAWKLPSDRLAVVMVVGDRKSVV